MKFLRSAPSKLNGNGNWQSMGYFLCEFCKEEVIRTRSRGAQQESCGCMRFKYKEKRLDMVEVTCLKCDSKFKSPSKFKRICEKCTIVNGQSDAGFFDIRVPHKHYSVGGHRN